MEVKMKITRRKLQELISEAINEGKIIASSEGALGDSASLYVSGAEKVKKIGNEKINNLVFSKLRSDRNTGVSIASSFIDLSDGEARALVIGFDEALEEPDFLYQHHVPFRRDKLKEKLIRWAESCTDLFNKYGTYDSEDPAISTNDKSTVRTAWFAMLEQLNDPLSFDTSGSYRNLTAAGMIWDDICAEIISEYPQIAGPIKLLEEEGWHPKNM
jgi:hypothetical protein